MGHGQPSEISFRGDDDDLRLVRPEPTICRMPRSTFFVCGVGILLAFGVIGISMAMMHSALPAFHETVDYEQIHVHLNALQLIADQNNGSRSIFGGFEESVQYIMGALEETKLQVTVQEFEVRAYKEEKPSTFATEDENGTFTSQDPLHFKALSYSGNGEVVGKISVIPGFGCEAGNYEQATAATVFLLRRGNCTFQSKVTHAQAHGALGAIVVSDDAVFTGTLGADSSVTIPAIAVSNSLGAELSNLGDKQVKFSVSGSTSVLVSKNIIAETNHGSEDDAIVIGSHLDSVEGAPGINDNGSGSAANLEIALTFHRSAIRPKNKVIFVWFGAEENGLVGSTYFVKNLKDTGAISKIAAYLNMDMIGSPNYIRAIYNGKEAENEAIRLGSGNIQRLFEQHFEEHELSFTHTDFDGRSDYGPFIENGIPAGGVFSGAEKLKTLEERKAFGGLALVPYDPCYHHACDSIENINKEAIVELVSSVADVLYKLSHDSAVRETLRTELTPEP